MSFRTFTRVNVSITDGSLSQQGRKAAILKLAEDHCHNMNEYNRVALDFCSSHFEGINEDKLNPQTMVDIKKDLYSLQKEMKEAIDAVLTKYQSVTSHHA